MIAPAIAPARYVVVGANHSSCPAALRDLIFVDDRAAPAFLAALKRAGIGQCLVVSTCDRVEVQAVHGEPDIAIAGIKTALARLAGEVAAEAEAGLYALVDTAAVRHVFAVAASLDSVVIGEAQVLGQVKAAHRLARAAGTLGDALEQLMAAAFATAKRVRSETALAQGPVTLAASALQTARSIHGDLARASALLIGPGEMAELIALKLREAGLGRLMVAATTAERATAAARRLDCQGVAFDALAQALDAADIVISGHGSGRVLLSAEMVEAALRRRRFRPMFLIDAAIPVDIEPAVARLEEAFLYDLDDLEMVAEDARAARVRAAAAAWAIVDAELARFIVSRAERKPAETVKRLYAQFEAARAEALSRAPADAAEATRWLIRRLLDRPARALRSDPGLEDSAARLFGLDKTTEDDDRDEGEPKP
ncbi:MAG: glutamyl-tRNA reductase [Alphaproteobacteria bacterium]|nr:glutamyl-tRNA reductase [Alphaproteobacteria bacterium]